MLPQLEATTYTGQLFWLFISFLLLYIGIARSVLPRMRSVLQQRAFRIESDMQKAEEFRKEAETILTEYDRMLEHTKISAASMIADAKQQADANIAAHEASADASVREKIHTEYTRIDALRADADSYIKESSAETADWILKKLSLNPTSTQVDKAS